MKASQLLLALLPVIALTWACGDNGEPSPAVTPTEDTSPPVAPTEEPSTSRAGKIAFISEVDGNREIYVINADGSGLTNITNNPALDLTPAWSPDGMHIAFSSDRDGGGIFVVNADGSGTRKIATTTMGSDPVWSLDGERIAFVSREEQGGPGDIFIVKSDGTELVNLTDSPEANDLDPAWSPDGKKIAFGSVALRQAEVLVMNLDGSDVRLLGPATSREAAWSPDGTRIAFIRVLPGSGPSGNNEIFVVNADGSELTNVTNNPGPDTNVMWSPDGKRIAFSFGNDIYLMDSDGADRTKLTDSPEAHGLLGFDWSPDGQRISFVRGRTALPDAGELWVVNADGSDETRILDIPVAFPIWSAP